MIWKLKPCPFCGGEVRVSFCNDLGVEGYGIFHTEDDADEECPIAKFRDEMSLGRYLYDTDKEAVIAWNRRAGEESKDA